MVKSNLVFWSIEDKSYLMDHPIRHIFSLLLLLTKPTAYQRYHEVALSIYEKWIKEFPGITDFVQEAMYHKVASEMEPSRQIPASMWKQTLIPWLRTISWDKIDIHELQKALEHDDEFKSILSPSVWPNLIKFIKNPESTSADE
jgi:hypothetical protein